MTKPADIRAWRARLMLRKEDAARLLGVSPRTYDYLESGRRPDGRRHVPSRAIGLACAAIRAGLAPIGDEGTAERLVVKVDAEPDGTPRYHQLRTRHDGPRYGHRAAASAAKKKGEGGISGNGSGE